MPMGGAPKLDNSSTIATWLHDAGYKTAYYGKYLNDYDMIEPYGYVPPGWDKWSVLLDAEFTNYNMSVDGETVKYGEAP